MLRVAGLRRLVIAGGSGFLGVSLAHHLADADFSVVLLSRRPPRPSGPWRHVTWDARSMGPWHRELDGTVGLVNLTGRSVDCIKTPDHQDEILRSRVEATRVLGEAIRAVDSPPPVWVQMSTAHIYGDPPEVTCTEASPFGYGLAPFVARAWEDEFHASVLPAQRPVVCERALCLGADHGAGNGALARLGNVGKTWVWWQSIRRTGDELDPRDGTESALRTSDNRSVDARRTHRIVAESGLADQSCETDAARLACRSACRRLSGWFDRGAMASEDGSSWRYTGVCCSERLQDEHFEFQSSTSARCVGRFVDQACGSGTAIRGRDGHDGVWITPGEE